MKRLLLLLFCCPALPALSQIDPELGFRFGAAYTNTIATLGEKSELLTDRGALLGFHAGVAAELPVNFQALLRTGLSFQQQGFEYELTRNSGGYRALVRTYQLHLPVVLAFNNEFFYLGAGPYASFGLFGRYQSRFFDGDGLLNGITKDEKLRWGDDDFAFFKRLDAGIIGEFGVNVSVLRISASYQYGLLNVSAKNNQEVREARNRAIQVAVCIWL